MGNAETPRLRASRRKKIGSAPVCRRVESTAWRIHRSCRAFPRRVHSIGAKMGALAPFGRRRRTAPPPENGWAPAEIASQKIGALGGAARARAVRARLRHAGLDHRARYTSHLAALPGPLFARPREAHTSAAPSVEMAQTHVAACGRRKGCTHLTKLRDARPIRLC